MTFTLSTADDGTKLEDTYAAAGYLPQRMDTWAAPVDAVFTEQIMRLRRHSETGNPAGDGQAAHKPQFGATPAQPVSSKSSGT
jgi:hypothetical protein